ncbi:CPBP family intramembrane glutamic endopeptidase [Haloplanus salilacus]|uniref:CPBP family intramembrane glutamic endopeptidase n=1 Tax=Haloplanus salilacus TaxID=2949994 RepID=UPI0030D43EB5
MPSLDETTAERLRAVGVALLVSAIGLGVGIGLVLVLSVGLVGLGLEPSPATLLVISLVSIQGIAFGGVALTYLRLRDRSLRNLGVRVPSVREVLIVVVGYAAAFVAAVTGALVVSVTGAPAGENQVAEFASADPTVLLWLVPASILLIGPGEELLFRGIVQGRLRETFDAVPGVVLASALFAGVHYVALTGGAGGRLVTVTVLFFPALVFGGVYELTDNLVVPSLVHGAYNATLFAFAYLAIRLSETGGLPREGASAVLAATTALPI